MTKSAIDRKRARLQLGASTRVLTGLESEFDDLLAQMQTRKAKKAMKASFNASQSQLGRAAIQRAGKKQ